MPAGLLTTIKVSSSYTISIGISSATNKFSCGGCASTILTTSLGFTLWLDLTVTSFTKILPAFAACCNLFLVAFSIKFIRNLSTRSGTWPSVAITL